MAITTHFCALMAQFSINNTSFVIGGTMWTAPLRQISMLWTNLSIKTKKVVKNANPFSVSMTKKNPGKSQKRHPKISLPALLPIILPTISCNKKKPYFCLCINNNSGPTSTPKTQDNFLRNYSKKNCKWACDGLPGCLVRGHANSDIGFT